MSYPEASPGATSPVKKEKAGTGPAAAKPAPAAKQKPLPGVEERVKKVCEALARVPKNRPSRVPRLRAFISDVFRQDVPAGAMSRTIKTLETAKILTIDAAGRVDYPDAL